MAILIDFEGPDYSYKSTIIDRLKEMMKEDIYLSKFNIYSFNSIRYGESSYYINNYLNSKYGKPSELNNTLKMALQAISRIDSIIDNKEIFDDDNSIILLDRYTLSNMIYNSNIYPDNMYYESEKITELNNIIDFEHYELKVPVPDFVVLMNQHRDLIKNAKDNRDDKQDDLESNEFYMDNIYDKYYGDNEYTVQYFELECYPKEILKEGSRNYELITSIVDKYKEKNENGIKLTNIPYPEYYCSYISALEKQSTFLNKYDCYKIGDNNKKVPIDLDTICNNILPDIKSVVAYKSIISATKKVRINTSNMEVF